MSNVLKKLSAFMPTIEDTVGNFEAIPAAQQPQPKAEPAAPVAVAQPVQEQRGAGDAQSSPPAVRERRRKANEFGDRLKIKGGGIDGRSLLRTGRTALMSIKVKTDLPDAMKAVAFEEGITLGELMDDMWAAYQQRRQSRRGRVEAQ